LASRCLFPAIRKRVWNSGKAAHRRQQAYSKAWNLAAGFNGGQAQALIWMRRLARNRTPDHLRRAAVGSGGHA
jgi:DNA-directed RNA polymerase specialized sigma24 family protein